MPEVFTAASVTFDCHVFERLCLCVFMCVCFVLAPASLYIQNASGIQIGNNNMMSIRGYDSSLSLISSPANSSANSPIKEGILKYGKP